MSERYVDRWHRNGAVAKVSYIVRSGVYEATMFPPPAEMGTTTIDRRKLPNLAAAQREADRMAHPVCDGACPAWPVRDPRDADLP